MTKVTNDHLSNDHRWHCGETYVRLNSLDVSNGRPNRDGIVRGWFDGERLVGHTDATLRSTDFPGGKFNPFSRAPTSGLACCCTPTS